MMTMLMFQDTIGICLEKKKFNYKKTYTIDKIVLSFLLDIYTYIHTHTHVQNAFSYSADWFFISAIRNVVVPATSFRKQSTGLFGMSPLPRFGDRELLRTIPVFKVKGGGDINSLDFPSSPT